MNNTIGTLQTLPGSSAVSGPGANASANASLKVEPVSHTKPDQTSLSKVSDLVAKALKQVDPSSDVRLDKILPIQKAIANGSYHVSASDVAGKIVDSLLS